jgi:hypothetical protein
MLRNAGLLIFVLALAGCKSRELGPYLSPRVTGQVCAADTSQPLANVAVTRNEGSSRLPGPPPKGAEFLMRKSPVRTDQEGRFVLSSERVLSIIRPSGWNLLVLDFERPDYEHLRTNFPPNIFSNSSGSEPNVDLGKIFLLPANAP